MSLSKQYNRFHFRFFLLIAAIIIAGIVGSNIIFLKNWQPAIQQRIVTFLSPTISSQSITTGDGSYVVPTDIPNQMKFVSPKLGMSFLYLEIKGVPKILTKEEGDKVYIYPDYHYSGFDYHTEPYVEVFQKDPNDTLETAIKKTILTGYPERDCFVVKNIRPYGNHSFPTNYTTAKISFPKTANLSEAYAAALKCPILYTPTNYISYFLMDKNRPDKFAFFKIGQGALSAEPRTAKTWDETLQFL